MKTGERGLALIKRFEGRRFRPYRCPAKLWTVGYGHVLYPEQILLPMEERSTFPLKSEDNRTFTTEEIDDFLVRDVEKFERGVTRLCPVPLRQNEYDALVSFAFNVGLGALQASTLRQKVKRSDFEGAAEEFKKWCKVSGKVVTGLLTRRLAESTLFLA